MLRPTATARRLTFFSITTATALLAISPLQARALPLGESFYAACTETFLKTSTSLVKKRTKILLKCSNALLACKLDDELGSGDFAGCAMSASAKCSNSIGKLAAGEESAVKKLDRTCAALADYDFQSSVGLGLRRLRAECGAVNSAADAYACLFSRVQCRASDIVEALAPRSYELFDAGGVLALVPDLAECLDARAPATPAGGDAGALADCQSGLAKALVKPLVKFPKDVARCVGDLLECRLHADRLRVNLPQPPDCYDDKDPAASCAKAAGRLTGAQGADLLVTAGARCGGIALADLQGTLGFESICPGAPTNTAVLDCARNLAAASTLELVDDSAPRTCQLSQQSGNDLFALGSFCAPECGNNVVESGEVCDDGNLDDVDSCTNDCQTGPTVVSSVTIPATLHPAHTPDGTPSNAVPMGGTLATMFGTTTPDLNFVSYMRYHAPGEPPAEAVLILIPGYSGGSGSLRVVSETLVANAAAQGLALEVWAFDRRTDQLEDDAGAELAEQEDDPELALNWYFGAELGLPLDPRIARRAVFHTDADIAFTANYTFHQTVHDVDDVVEAALALPGPPTVFVGGHSLGTLLAAHYAATDLDPGVALEPGYQKIAGLVLFEGEGDTIQTTPPSADALDLVISKADGGLYHAIKNGDGRCWDGSPCTSNADCSGVTPPPGALTSKCVPYEPGYPSAIVTPQIHAIGDAASLQGRRNPDSLTLAQVDYGVGKAVNVVPGLSLLGFLPRGSAEAAVGFFLDDDFSPEVSFMVSAGFSDNGPNNDLGYYLAAPSTRDPYRYWRGIAAPQPPTALPDHGAPVDAYTINGVEREMTPMESVLTMLRSGPRNIGDWYFPVAGLYTTEDLIIGDTFFKGLLDSTPLSVGRGRPDIENVTEGMSIDIPVIAFGGSNGIAPTLGSFLPFAEDIGACTAPSCDGTPRVVMSDPIAPVFGDVGGGFEAYVAEGYGHLDVVAAPDSDAHDVIYGPLVDFLERNTP